MQQCFFKMKQLIERGDAFVCVTFIESRGHAPQDAGARALVRPDGLFYGTVGGGKIEAKAIALAQALLSEPSEFSRPKNHFVTWNLQRDVGMSCGGEVSLFFEIFGRNQWNIAVFGAGHVAQALIPLLASLDSRVVCLDSRIEWLEKLPERDNLKRVCASDLSAEVSGLAMDSFILLMTQGHAVDFPILLEILRTRKPPYLGVIGSPVKAMKLRQELVQAGISPSQAESFFCPIGLNIGSNHPGEIAISMAAQLLEVRDRGLKSRDKSNTQSH